MNIFKMVFDFPMLALAALLMLLVPQQWRAGFVAFVFPGDAGLRLLALNPGLLFMTTLAANSPRAYEQGLLGHLPVIAADIIYEGAAVGTVKATGHARPLAAGDRFEGFATRKADNSAGAAAAINVEVQRRGQVELTVTGVLITDINLPVYASDDDTFQMSPVGGSFVGFVKRFVSTNKAVVGFDLDAYADPHGDFTVRETISADKTLDAEDSGKLFWVDTDAKTITLPAVAVGSLCKIVNGGGYGTVLVTISPNASDSIEGPDITAADDKDILNTKATAQRGDCVVLGDANADGYIVTEMKGVWARQA